MEYDLAMWKKEILPFVTTWMDFEDIMLSVIGKDKYCVISLIYGVFKKPNSQKNESEMTVTRGWRVGK